MDDLLTRRQVCERVQLSRSRIYALMRLDEFPLPFRIGRRAVRWSSGEIEKWLDTRPRAIGDTREAASH